MWLVRLLETEGDWFKGQGEAWASALWHRKAARSCWIRPLSLTLSASLFLSHTHWSEVYECTRCIMQYMVCACINTFLCHGSWSMHPSPKPKQRKRSSMSSKETETVQYKYTDRHRQTEPYIETVWPNEFNGNALCQLQHRPESKLCSWKVDVQAAEWAQCCSWPN